MSRVTRFALVAAALALPALPAAAGEAYTTRIEPRPFYGATVTLEEGVRVFRALPVQRHVIINPDNKTSLSLNFTEERRISNSYHHGNGDGSGGDSGDGTHGRGYSGLGTPSLASGSGGDNGVFPGGRTRARGGSGPKIISAKPAGTFGGKP